MGRNSMKEADKQSILFGDPTLAAIYLLREEGYKVVRTREELRKLAIDEGFIVTDPTVIDVKIKTIPELRTYFNRRLWERNRDRQSSWIEGNLEQELRAFRLFVEARESAGLNRFNAIQQCVAIIDTIFDCEDLFHFDRPIDIRVIGQGKAGWITQKALLLLHDAEYKKQESEFKKRIEDAELELENKVDLDKAASDLDKMLAKMESNER